MGYIEFLADCAKANRSIVCLGLDPILEKLPPSVAGREERIVGFFSEIVDAALCEQQVLAGASIGAIKPNYAYFAQYGFDGLRALKALIDRYKGKVPIIFDGKRGDIGRSSEAYAKEVFDFWNADATTVSPYMGEDSVMPFIERCKQGRGVYILCKTSNSGSHDLQSMVLDNGKQVFAHVASKMEKWHVDGVGAVFGATYIDELETIIWQFYDSHKKLPLLIPGVGAQGGSAADTAKILRTVWRETLPLHRINSSSGITYAYQKYGSTDYVGCALKEIGRLNQEIGAI
ncbi:orotidine-5'-phosphate decarboxylase [Candidatus Parvarchaeota archaeon]|nr:orotidine-5'-phosphate decarboxylase [Candidatus Parvarchaeota archaeon]